MKPRRNAHQKSHELSWTAHEAVSPRSLGLASLRPTSLIAPRGLGELAWLNMASASCSLHLLSRHMPRCRAEVLHARSLGGGSSVFVGSRMLLELCADCELLKSPRCISSHVNFALGFSFSTCIRCGPAIVYLRVSPMDVEGCWQARHRVIQCSVDVMRSLVVVGPRQLGSPFPTGQSPKLQKFSATPSTL